MTAITTEDEAGREPAGDESASSHGHELPIRFTASGSEYFRIWIVNLLLTLVTLGLYSPWAKVRKRRYFYGNTWVGEDAFDFHGNPWKMLRGMLLVGAMFVAYSLAGHVSPAAGAVALVIVCCVAPALFLTSMRFRMANTSWRGMRFHFSGDMAGVYKAMAPSLVFLLAFGVLMALMPDPHASREELEAARQRVWAPVLLSLVMMCGFFLVPFFFWSIKRFQHGHYALGRVRTQLRTGPGAFYLVFLKSMALVSAAVFAMVLLVVIAVVAAVGVASLNPDQWKGAGPKAFIALGLGFILLYAVILLVSNTFMVSRLQNLVWTRTKSTEVRFESRLRLRSLLWLTVKNLALLMLTMGLYWPFAAVAMARLKLEAVTVFTRRSVDDLAGRAGAAGAQDAAGDAAADVFGLDLGL